MSVGLHRGYNPVLVELHEVEIVVEAGGRREADILLPFRHPHLKAAGAIVGTVRREEHPFVRESVFEPLEDDAIDGVVSLVAVLVELVAALQIREDAFGGDSDQQRDLELQAVLDFRRGRPFGFLELVGGGLSGDHLRYQSVAFHVKLLCAIALPPPQPIRVHHRYGDHQNS